MWPAGVCLCNPVMHAELASSSCPFAKSCWPPASPTCIVGPTSIRLLYTALKPACLPPLAVQRRRHAASPKTRVPGVGARDFGSAVGICATYCQYCPRSWPRPKWRAAAEQGRLVELGVWLADPQQRLFPLAGKGLGAAACPTEIRPQDRREHN